MKKRIAVIVSGLLLSGIALYALASSPLSLTGQLDSLNNAVDLSWFMNDKSDEYVYKVYQKKEGTNEFQSISTANLHDEVKVLNVYPDVRKVNDAPRITYRTWDGTRRTLPASAALERWMEEPNPEHPKGYGRGIIDVTPVALTDFNVNPERYLKAPNGEWRYDVIMFGSWDENGSSHPDGDLSIRARNLVRNFIEDGRGVLFGHDTIVGYGTDHTRGNFGSLRTYVNIQLREQDRLEDAPWVGSDKVKILRQGLLNKWPWDIGDPGTVLTIPYAHSTAEYAHGDVWMEFTEVKGFASGPVRKNPRTNTGTNNFYLTTWNNVAKIQTGHSSGKATPDEQKILANTLFYLSQLTERTSHKDRSAMDYKAPDQIKSVTYNNETNTLTVERPKDNGTTYQYYVEAFGKREGKTYRSNTITVTNATGVKGYSYVIDDKPNTEPDDIIDATSDSFELNLSEATGNILHIKAIDYAGNSSETAHFELQFLTLKGKVDHENNAIHLSWNKMPDRSQSYVYRVYQKKEGSDEFQTISTTNIDKREKVRVLNIYPVTPPTFRNEGKEIPIKEGGGVDLAGKPVLESAALSDWIGNYGHGLIEVDVINQIDFNNDPDQYLKDENGEYIYDVVAVGFWNIREQEEHLGNRGVDALREFVESGRGLLTGHHHIGMFQLDSGMNRLKDLFGVKFVIEDGWSHMSPHGSQTEDYVDYIAPEKSRSINSSMYWYNSDKVIAVKRGLLLEYPNDVSEPGRILDIPETHNTNDFVMGDVWLEFYEPKAHGRGSSKPISITKLPDGTEGAKNAYLSTYNNTAIIQTGHASHTTGGKMVATEDEQKVIANTIFYLAQLTSDTELLDRSGLDAEPPTKPDNVKTEFNSNGDMVVSYTGSKDLGSTYEYFIEAVGADGRTFRSNTIQITNTSGLAGYSYVLDNNPNTIPDKTVDVTGTSFTIKKSNLNGEWLHLLALDRAGNASEVIHIQIDNEGPDFKIIPSTTDWTNNDVVLTVVDITDKGVGYARAKLPDGTFTTSTKPTFTVEKNGKYSFTLYDRIGNFTTKSIEIKNIDKKEPGLSVKQKNGNQIELRYHDE